MPSFGIIAEIKNNVDTKKIQELMAQANVDILVGFPSGRVHIEAVHEQNSNGSFKGGSKAQTKTNTNGETKEVETWELAQELHFGTATIPARPFLSDGLEANAGVLKKAIAKEVDKQKDGNIPNWNKIGSMAVGVVQDFVRGDYYKINIPNGEAWQREKGSDTPLIDGGDLINSMSFIVEGK